MVESALGSGWSVMAAQESQVHMTHGIDGAHAIKIHIIKFSKYYLIFLANIALHCCLCAANDSILLKMATTVDVMAAQIISV